MAEIIEDNEIKKDSFFSEKTGKIISISGLLIIGLTILLFSIFGSWNYSWALDEGIIGQFGDFIGGFIGSLFSLAGVILFYVALKEQRRDIGINQENFKLQTAALEQQVLEFKDQKTELEETRKVYIEQTTLIRVQTDLYRQQNKELKEQSQIAKNQQFDSSYFSYLTIFNNYKNSLNSLSETGNYFWDIVLELREIEIIDNEIEKTLNKICDGYLAVFTRNRDKLSPYFKTLYRIMVLIDISNIDDHKKEEYFKFLRSQLSDVELLVLNYNYHTNLGIKVRGLIIKYNFLKHLNLFDKLEFSFDLSDEVKFNIESFLKYNELKIREGIRDYKNIESSEDIDRSYFQNILNLKVEIKLIIKECFIFSITFEKKDLHEHEVLNNEFIENLIKRHLYTVLFMSQYLKANEDEFLTSTVDSDEKIEYQFTIINIENL